MTGIPETSDDRNSAKSKQTNFKCGHCGEPFDSSDELAHHTVDCPERGE